MSVFTCEFYLCSLKLQCYLLSRLLFQQGLLITWGRSAPALDDSPSPKEDDTTCSWAMEWLKEGLGLSIYPKEQKLREKFFCAWLIHFVSLWQSRVGGDVSRDISQALDTGQWLHPSHLPDLQSYRTCHQVHGPWIPANFEGHRT